MDPNFFTSNLSKIATKFRTSGTVSQPRRKAGSPLIDIGNTNSDVVRITTPDEYLGRLYKAFDTTTDAKMKQFLYIEIRKILIQRNLWK